MVTLILNHQESRTLENHNIAKEKNGGPHTGQKLIIVVGFAIIFAISANSSKVVSKGTTEIVRHCHLEIVRHSQLEIV
jgi:hypothetical protein